MFHYRHGALSAKSPQKKVVTKICEQNFWRKVLGKSGVQKLWAKRTLSVTQVCTRAVNKKY